MTFRTDIPRYDDLWDDLIYHSGWAYPVQGEVEISCEVVDENTVKVAGHTMTVTRARLFVAFAEEELNQEGVCGLSRELVFETKAEGVGTTYRVPGHILASAVTWLKNALGDEPYDGPSDRWEH